MTSAPPPAPPDLDPPYYGPPPPPPPGPPVREQLRRSRTDKVIGGVAGGLARYSGIDPLLWRVGFIALAFAGGTGVLVYLLLWLLMPATPVSPAEYPKAVEPAVPAGPRSPVPGVTMAAVLIAMGVLALLTRLLDWDPGPRIFIGTALLIVGLGLVAAAFIGGRTAKGGLIALGVVLSLALLIASTAPWEGARGGVGDRTWTPLSAEAVRASYDGGVGDLRLDMSRVDVSDLDGPIRTTLHSGIGDVAVVVPDDADVRVIVSHGLGDLSILDGEASDGDLYPGTDGTWVNDGSPEIILTIDAGIGDVEVNRA
jgi:phage shock protein PspC (stress-responsive transcriptional regulator)